MCFKIFNKKKKKHVVELEDFHQNKSITELKRFCFIVDFLETNGQMFEQTALGRLQKNYEIFDFMEKKLFKSRPILEENFNLVLKNKNKMFFSKFDYQIFAWS